MDSKTPTTTKPVFNKGARIYRHNDIEIHPGVFTQLPEADANSLLEKFPHELVSDKAIGASGVASDEIEKLRSERATLEAQVDQLTKVINSEPEDSKAAANRRAQLAEAKAAELQKQLDALQAPKSEEKVTAKTVKGGVVKGAKGDEFEDGNTKS